MGKSNNAGPDEQEKAATASTDAQAGDAIPASVSTADNVLSASDGQVVVGGVTVIEHQQDSGEANEEHGGA